MNKNFASSQKGETNLEKIASLVKDVLERGGVSTTPKFYIYTGGVGSGKTTLRREQLPNGFVHFDWGEIFSGIKNRINSDDKLIEFNADLAANLILENAIQNKQNIVIEVIGDRDELLTPIMDAMTKRGYKINLQYVHCDPVEAYKRHLKAVKDDPDYMSSYFYQERLLSCFFKILGLRDIPSLSKK